GGIPMIEYVLAAGRHLNPASIVLVIGHEADRLRSALGVQEDVTCVVQEPQLGTAHALQTTAAALEGRTGTLVLLSGDVPLLRPRTLEDLGRRHEQSGAAATLLTAHVEDPRGYGRIVRSGEQIARVVEEKDASSAEKGITEINAGIYAFTLEGLFDALAS